MRLIQLCNVGQILGGTAACAWTVTRALPGFDHLILTRTRPTAETIARFAPVPVLPAPDPAHIRWQDHRPDLLLLHNTPRSAAPQRGPVPAVQYLHSRIGPAAADVTVACSHWLAGQYPRPVPVCWQAVPVPPRPPDVPHDDARPRVGRLCTPTLQKFPAPLVPFYETLAARHPDILWEFVGCPPSLRSSLETACQGRVAFHEAGWSARSRLWSWDAMLYHHPTLTESFGRTACEALRAGCVPIVDDRGGFREQLAPGTGRLATDLDDFSDALTQMTAAPEAWSRRREACRAHADEHFSLDAFARRLLGLFEAALNPAHPTRVG